MYVKENYWKNYMKLWFDPDYIRLCDENREEKEIISNQKPLHIESYISDKSKPTLVFSHGIAGYSRVLLPFVLPLYKNGINIICPDLQGYGYNKHRKGDFTWNNHVQNLVDTVRYAESVVTGPIFLGGASMGGPLAYEAASRIDNIKGLICWCLWDLGGRKFIENETALGKMTFVLLPFLKFLSKLFGQVRFKTYSVISYDTLSSDKKFNEMVKKDPQAGTMISLRGMLSLILESAISLPYEKWTRPILVVQPEEDKMTPPEYIEKAFDRLGSKVKKYVSVQGSAHFPTELKYYETWKNEVANFVDSINGDPND